MQQPGISPELLDKYLAGQRSGIEKKQVEAWYASLTGEADFLGTLPPEEQQHLQENTFEHILSEIRETDEKPHRKLRWGWLTGIAASIALVTGIYFFQKHADNNADISAIQLHPAAPAETRRFVNAERRIVTFVLPDSSTVQLHPGAEIVYPRAFSGNQRRVTFSGEGFFDIKKDKSRPFLISSGEMMIRVLGTSFNVKAVRAQKTFQIDVVTGSVQVTAPDPGERAQQVTLKPQEQALFETASRKLTAKIMQEQARREIYQPVSIDFEETPLRQVVDQLQKRFNIRIELAEPKLASCTLTARFDADPLPIILEMVCTSLDATYAIAGSIVTISGAGCE
ncbi:FecR family protein [Dyadobacter sandarakinus]|uniref:FecR domain-containing protein n=1 Tax=Dyadobacter sandarakinus TaxID=2747268 RepID=A0ABX7I7R0_9BACT|nr:FecR domain-containing protein [Dyadobacter sandarakinus]QRR01026.1 FecR domain-containing protein [Dyadobacter sandarakinus]